MRELPLIKPGRSSRLPLSDSPEFGLVNPECHVVFLSINYGGRKTVGGNTYKRLTDGVTTAICDIAKAVY